VTKGDVNWQRASAIADPVAQSFQLGALVAFGLVTRISFIPFAAVFGFGYLAALRRRWLAGIGECC